MKKYKKPLLLLTLTLCLVAGAVFLFLQSRQTTFKEKNGTNTNAATVKEDVFFTDLEANYPDFYQLIPKDGRSTYTIPGLIQTVSLVAKGEDKGEAEIVEDMTPQGLAFVEDMVAISAYSKSKEFRSVIWLLNRQTGEYIKTVVLPTNSHVGGIAYDDQHKLLWMTTTEGDDTSQISAVTLQQLREDRFEDTEEPISFHHRINLARITRSSYMTYEEKGLYVGYFDKDDLGHVGYYPIDGDGLPVHHNEEEDIYLPQIVYDTPEQVQGMAFIDDKVVFSQSYGNKNSRLLYFDNPGRDNWTHFEEDKNLLAAIEAPAYLEQIIAGDGLLYLLFESSAIQYRDNPTVTSMDRIIKIVGEKP